MSESVTVRHEVRLYCFTMPYMNRTTCTCCTRGGVQCTLTSAAVRPTATGHRAHRGAQARTPRAGPGGGARRAAVRVSTSRVVYTEHPPPCLVTRFFWRLGMALGRPPKAAPSHLPGHRARRWLMLMAPTSATGHGDGLW
eukprot:403686-Prymnesium_polylepis.1